MNVVSDETGLILRKHGRRAMPPTAIETHHRPGAGKLLHADPKTQRAYHLYHTAAYKGTRHTTRRHVQLALWSVRGAIERKLRRLRDLTIALTVLAILSPLLVFLSLLIKIDSPGPVLFRQERVGKDGKVFTLYKFRSMVVQAEVLKRDLEALNETSRVHFKMRRDPRITRVGRLIRKTSLDELPQLVNVLKGEMSTVGPRPALPTEVVEIEFNHLRRLDVSPGLTGLQQVSGRSELDYEQWMNYDLQYIDSRSLGKDVEILLKTIPAVLSGKGAY